VGVTVARLVLGFLFLPRGPTSRGRVRAFVSGIDTANDVSSEVFYLEPEEG
jgi:hypothetical protein